MTSHPMTMVEKIARAMQDFIRTPLPNATTPPSEINLRSISADSLGFVWELLARAAIEEACKPSPQMIAAAAQLLDLYCEGSLGPHHSKNVAERVLQAGISAALREEGP